MFGTTSQLMTRSHSSFLCSRNQLGQCRNYDTQNGSSGWFNNLFLDRYVDKSTGAVYAPGSVTGRQEGGEKVVVAVLGLAHCNGIMKLLTED
jgi:hypothetical protein